MPPIPPRLRPLLDAITARLALAVVGVSALALLVSTLDALGSHFLRSPLARDPAQFQFVAWAISRGSVDYRDLHDMNAPLSHAVHWLFMHLGGLDERRFRHLELFTILATVGAAGYLLPRRAPALSTRLVAGLCVGAAVVAEYLRTFPWHLSQRDAFAVWFVLPAAALSARAIGVGVSDRWRRNALLGAGALVGLATTLKPYFGLMGVPLMAGALACLPRGHRLKGALYLVVGGALGTLPALLFMLVFGSVSDYLREGFVHGPLFYKGLYDRPLRDIFHDSTEPFPWMRGAAASTVVGLALVGLRFLRASNLPVILSPAAAAGIVLIQHKGFGYHMHVTVAATLLLWVQVLLTAVERAPRKVLPALSVGLVGAGLAAWSVSLQPTSALLWPVCLAYERMADGDINTLPPGPGLGIPDYFPLELRRGAAWLRANTPADARVFVYGHDVPVLLYARRRPATALISSVSIDLAGLLLPPGRNALEPARVRGLEAMQRRNIGDALARLRREPPAACVLIDRSPWMTEPTALADLQRHAPELAAVVTSGYVEAEAFGPVHVWRRR